jgi:inosose dehydratase
MMNGSRRNFLQLAGAAGAAAALPFSRLAAQNDAMRAKKNIQFEFGMASYTFKAFTLDQTIEMTKRLGLRRLALKDFHLPMTLTPEEIAVAVKKVKAAGLVLSSLGVIYMKSEDDVRKAFAYTQAVGIKLMNCAPTPDLLGLAERMVKETDISIAIHNHGPDNPLYSRALDAYKLIAPMDKRMGLCLDIGHTQRLAIDPTEELERCFDRVFDMHIKDVSASSKEGKTIEMGRGVIDIPKLLRRLIAHGYARTLHYEFEKDEKDPLPGTAESVGYVNGVIAAL